MDKKNEVHDYRKGKKTKLRLNARRKRVSNISKYHARRKLIWDHNSNLTGTDENSPSTSSEKHSDTSPETILSLEDDDWELTPMPEENLQSIQISAEEDDTNCINITTREGLASENKSLIIEGRRVVNFQYIFDSLQEINSHNKAMGCSLNDVVITNEVREGHKSVFGLHCKMCNLDMKLHSEDPTDEKVDLNVSAVAGIMNIGSGFGHLQSFMSSMNIPPMSPRLYQQIHQRVAQAWEHTALDIMRNAAEEEKAIALQSNSIDKDGVPLIRVVCDGSWAKRSYKSNYSSLSGVGAIVGYNTKKVLYIGVKNKYCTICARAERLNTEIPEHTCYKNWNASSSSMEAAAITDGFVQSEAMYGVRYHQMIADGDSSCYKKILEARPYNNLTVQKIECRNHLLRNMCNKLRDVSTSKKNGPFTLRSVLRDNIVKCRIAVVKAAQHRRDEALNESQKIRELEKDILNIASHVFGEHKECNSRQYFCQKTGPDEINYISEFKQHGLHAQMMDIFRYLSFHSKSLIYDVDSNYVEQFNNIICKFIGGKRINYTLRGSYQARCSAAVVSCNTHLPLYQLHKHLSGQSPGKFTKLVETQRLQTLRKRHYKKTIKQRSITHNISNKDYGDGCQKVDLTEEQMKVATTDFLKSLEISSEERSSVEERTRGQSNSSEWFEQRRKLLTASNFGIVCRRRPYTTCVRMVNQILYKQGVLRSKSTFWGKMKEPVAREALEKTQNVEISDCGLIIDAQIPFLGATPDGYIGQDGIVEIKCPYASRMFNPDDGIKKKLIKFWKLKDGSYVINKKHYWYYQIQGQLHIAQKQYCLLGVWTNLGLKCELIFKDDTFWEQEMKSKLIQFYKECILPELVDPRVPRHMPIREAPYIQKAQEERHQKEQKLQQQKRRRQRS